MDYTESEIRNRKSLFQISSNLYMLIRYKFTRNFIVSIQYSIAMLFPEKKK